MLILCQKCKSLRRFFRYWFYCRIELFHLYHYECFTRNLFFAFHFVQFNKLNVSNDIINTINHTYFLQVYFHIYMNIHVSYMIHDRYHLMSHGRVSVFLHRFIFILHWNLAIIPFFFSVQV